MAKSYRMLVLIGILQAVDQAEFLKVRGLAPVRPRLLDHHDGLVGHALDVINSS
jgi:hypothetical protein